MILYIFLSAALFFLAFYIYQSFKKSDTSFEENKNQIQNDITTLNRKIKTQQKKIELADDMKKSIKNNNAELFTKIATLNTTLFEEVSRKNKL